MKRMEGTTGETGFQVHQQEEEGGKEMGDSFPSSGTGSRLEEREDE